MGDPYQFTARLLVGLIVTTVASVPENMDVDTYLTDTVPFLNTIPNDAFTVTPDISKNTVHPDCPFAEKSRTQSEASVPVVMGMADSAGIEMVPPVPHASGEVGVFAC